MGYNPSMHGELLDRFLDYASYDTMSDGARADEGVRPSAEGEERLLLHLKEELEALGIEAFYGEEKVLCAKKGVVSRTGSCRAFRYDPLKRVPPPPRPLDLSGLKDEDFTL